MKHYLGFVVAIVAVTAFCQDALGAIVVWGDAQNIMGAADVSLSGTFEDAMEVYTGGSALTVNTVPFSTATSAANDLGTSGTVKLTSNGAGKIVVTTNAQASSFIPSVGDANYTALLGTFSYAGANNAFFFNGLMAGRTYLVQVWSSQNDTTVNDPELVGSPSVVISRNVGGSGIGQFAIGTFIAGGTSDSFAYGPGPSSTFADINAVQLRLLPVPEPNSVILIGCGAASCAAIARRRRQV